MIENYFSTRLTLLIGDACMIVFLCLVLFGVGRMYEKMLDWFNKDCGDHNDHEWMA